MAIALWTYYPGTLSWKWVKDPVLEDELRSCPSNRPYLVLTFSISDSHTGGIWNHLVGQGIDRKVVFYVEEERRGSWEFCLFVCLLGGTGVWTQSLRLISQSRYHLSHSTSSRIEVWTVPLELHLQSILLWSFWRWDSLKLSTPRWPWVVILPIFASQVARITGMSLQCLASIILFWY
jgi:hypothetical protein